MKTLPLRTAPVKVYQFLYDRLEEEEKFINSVDILTSLPSFDEGGDPVGFFTTQLPEMSEYIVVFQPQRMREEIAVKRRVLSKFEVYELKRPGGEVFRYRLDNRSDHDLLYAMASLYSDHKDYAGLFLDTP